MPCGTACERRAQVGSETLCELARIAERCGRVAAAMVGELRLDPMREGAADPDAVELALEAALETHASTASTARTNDRHSVRCRPSAARPRRESR